MNHVVLLCASGCESCCAMLSKWLWIMANYDVPVVVNHVVLCLANGCELWWVMLWQWLWIMLYYAEPVVGNHDVNAVTVCVNHIVLFWASRWESRCEHCASRCESWWAMLKQWLGITLRMLCKWVWITMCYSVPIGVTHGELCWGSCCESCCVIMCQWWWFMLCYA